MNKKMTIKEMYKEYENDPEFMKGLMVTNFLSEVYEIMENNHITKSELAKRMNVSRQYITKLFTGYANFTLMTLAQIAAALNLKPEIRLKGKEEDIKISINKEQELQYKDYTEVVKYADKEVYYENCNFVA